MDARNTSQVFKVRRAFRGSVLWLTHYEAWPLSMQWSTAGKPKEFESSAAALAAADKAAREYGAECAVTDADGNLLQPKAARKVSAPLAALNRYVENAIANGAEPITERKVIPEGAECVLLSSGARFAVIRHTPESITVEARDGTQVTVSERDFAVRYKLTGKLIWGGLP